MRIQIVLAITLVIFSGCDVGESLDENHLTTEFALYTFAGQRTSIFTIGDTVVVHLKVTNNTGRDLPYHYTGTLVVLEILQGNSVVATSADGLVFPQIVVGAVLKSGESITIDWHAPNTPWSSERKFLTPGVYTADVAPSGFFGSFRVDLPPSIQFQVYPGNV